MLALAATRVGVARPVVGVAFGVAVDVAGKTIAGMSVGTGVLGDGCSKSPEPVVGAGVTGVSENTSSITLRIFLRSGTSTVPSPLTSIVIDGSMARETMSFA